MKIVKYITKNLITNLNNNYFETINTFKDLTDLLKSLNYFKDHELNDETKKVNDKNKVTIDSYIVMLNSIIDNYKLSIVTILSVTSSFKSFDENTKSITTLRNQFKSVSNT